MDVSSIAFPIDTSRALLAAHSNGEESPHGSTPEWYKGAFEIPVQLESHRDGYTAESAVGNAEE